jgi:transposase
MSNGGIARELGRSRNTVSETLRTTRLTVYREKKRVSKLDPYGDETKELIEKHLSLL